MNEFEKVERKEITDFWQEKFGVPPKEFSDYTFYMKGKSKVWIHTNKEPPDNYRYESIGLPFLRVGGEHPKPTTDALQIFGEHASKNKVPLDQEQAKKFIQGETINQEFSVDSLGYVIATHQEKVLGCGLYFPGELRSQVPKGRRANLNL